MNTTENNENVAKKLWNILGDIPINEDDELEEDFDTNTGLIFESGTDKFEVWNWFEEHFNLSVAEDLMFKTKN